MRYLIAIAVLFVAQGCASLTAETVEPSRVFRATNDDGSPIVFRAYTAKPCTDEKVIGWLTSRYGVPPPVLEKFKAAVLTWKGSDWSACWMEMNGFAVSVDSEGAQFQSIPMRLLRDETL
jgi:hypothetical protein